MSSGLTINVIVLAGDRGPEDPLAVTAGVAGKTLVPVAGRAMLSHVLTTLKDWPKLGRIVLVAPSGKAYQRAIDASGIESGQLLRIDPAATPARSVSQALEAAGPARPLLLTTADHALLDRAWLDQLLSQAPACDVAVGLVDWAAVMQRFPGSRRTRYRFRDRSICGTNLFLFQTPAGQAVIRTWQQVEQDRKRPWKIVGLLGWANLARYMAGRLTLNKAFDGLSERIEAQVAGVLLDDPLTAVDIDSAADLALVEQVFAERSRPC